MRQIPIGIAPVFLQLMRSRANRKLAEFERDERGGMLAFTIVTFLMIVVATGMAVDFMRHEMARADLQNALDRGVLAVTSVDQTLVSDASSAKTVINDYMESRSYRAPVLDLSVQAPAIPGGRRITASASYTLDTIFLPLIGMETIDVNVISQAEQAASDLEISLILDVSHSMTESSSWNAGGTRLSDLKTAAKQFITAILNDENKNRTMISVIPYSGQVNLSEDMAEVYNVNRHHSYSNCVDFDANDYKQAAVTTSQSLAQTQHFSDSNYNEWYRVSVTRWEWRRTYWGWRQVPIRTYEWRRRLRPSNFVCPDNANQILPYSNSVSALHGKIDGLQSESWTAAYTGTKWGVAMLDPSAQSLVSSLISKGKVSSDFQGWPRNWDDRGTRKIIVLMTDGRNTRQYRADALTYGSQTPDYWNTNGFPYDSLIKWVDNDNDGFGDKYLGDICSAAKGAGSNAIIYTIGFELHTAPEAAAVLKSCASSPSTHYLVEAVNIDLAFQNIASQIKNLKLTQ